MQEGRDKVMIDFQLWCMYHEDWVIPEFIAIVIIGLGLAAYIHWRY